MKSVFVPQIKLIKTTKDNKKLMLNALTPTASPLV
jgi:hypothetical protein